MANKCIVFFVPSPFALLLFPDRDSPTRDTPTCDTPELRMKGRKNGSIIAVLAALLLGCGVADAFLGLPSLPSTNWKYSR